MKKQGRLPRMGKCNKTALWSSEAMKKLKVDKKKKERSEVVKWLRWRWKCQRERDCQREI